MNLPRFVVLHHQMPRQASREDHWDFMLETNDVLTTWALQDVPTSGQPNRAEQLAPHRLHYLDYEGPLSAERGTVTQWDRGTYEWLRRETMLMLRVQGRHLHGAVTLHPADDHWIFTFEPDVP